MNYNDFINTLSRRLEYETEKTASFCASVVGVITKKLQAGETVCLSGFGNFSVLKQLEHVSVNSLTGQRTLEPPRLEVRFEFMSDQITEAKESNLLSGDAETFVKEFCSLLAEGLRTDNYVNIKGLGTFKKIEGNVSYVPDSVLRDTINKPFSHFEAVVLAEGVDFSEIDAKPAEEEAAVEDVQSQSQNDGPSPQTNEDLPQETKPEETKPEETKPEETKPQESSSDEGLQWGIIAPIFLAGLLIGGFLVWAVMTYWNQ